MDSSVYSVLKNVLPEGELDPREFDQGEDENKQKEMSRLKDDLIDLAQLQGWFSKMLVVSNGHEMSMKDIWRNFCYDSNVYCSLALFGNLVYRHVFNQSPYWSQVTRVGETNNKKYNLEWSLNKTTVSNEKLDEFFGLITAEKEKRQKRHKEGEAILKKTKNSPKLQPEMLISWWENTLEPSPASEYMKMREIWARFTKETGIQISLALFGELSVRYVLRSNPRFVGVARTRGIHDKKYSLRWKTAHKTDINWGFLNSVPNPSDQFFASYEDSDSVVSDDYFTYGKTSKKEIVVV